MFPCAVREFSQCWMFQDSWEEHRRTEATWKLWKVLAEFSTFPKWIHVDDQRSMQDQWDAISWGPHQRPLADNSRRAMP